MSDLQTWIDNLTPEVAASDPAAYERFLTNGQVAQLLMALPTHALARELARRGAAPALAPPLVDPSVVTYSEVVVLPWLGTASSRTDHAGIATDVWADLCALAAGDPVDVLLDSGEVIRTYVRVPPRNLNQQDVVDEGATSMDVDGAWCVWLHGVRGSYALARVRRVGGWSRA